MSDWFSVLTTPGAGFMPHGMCYAWRADILWLHVGSDALIAAAYLSIPFALMTFVRRRQDLEFRWVFHLFAAFILWCALTHAMNVWVIWQPDYGAQGLIKLATAAVSLATAVVLWPLIPQALAVPGPAQLKRANIELEEARDRLEERVAQRTAELSEARERLRLVIDASPSGMLLVDEQGNIEIANGAIESLFGYSREALLGERVELLVPDGVRSLHRQYRDDYLRAPRARPMAEDADLFARRRDGTTFPVEIGLSPLSMDGKFHVLASVMDITHRKRTEQALRQSNEDLEQFAYAASHDLQEPLRAVSGCLKMLKEHLGDELDAEADELMTHAVDGAERMRVLIDDLLAYSRIDRRGGRFEAVALSAAVGDALSQLEVAVAESDARVDIADDLPVVRGDRTQLTLLLQNLMNNAIKYCSAERSPLVRVDARRGDGQWIVSVSDNGIGIAAEHRERVFQIFKRLHTRRQYQGTGIGLAICARIVKRHGGTLWLESEPGEGSIFHFSIPDDGEDSP